MSKRIGRWCVVFAAGGVAGAGLATGVGSAVSGCAASPAVAAGGTPDVAADHRPTGGPAAADRRPDAGDAAAVPTAAAGPRPGELAVASADAGLVAAPGVAPGTAAPGVPAAPPPAPISGSQVVARIDTPRGERVVTADQILRPLLDAHGLTILLQVVQLELARDQAEANKFPGTATPQEVAAEREALLGKMFEQSDAENDRLAETFRKQNKPDLAAKYEKKKAEDRELLLSNYMEQARISPAEFEIVLQTNVFLRKVARQQIEGRIDEATLRREFADKYNEQVRVRHIELGRGQVAEAKRRLAAGEPFGKVAKDLSANKATAALEGEVPPFAQSNTALPQAFRDAAFALKEGQVSEVVNVGDAYHLIKLEQRIPPKTVTFEAVRDSLVRDLTERATLLRMGQLRGVLGTAARQKLRIQDPVMAEQFRKKVEAFDQQVQRADRERILMDLERRNREREAAAATQPAGPAAPAAPGTPAAPDAGGAAPVFGPGPGPAAAPPAPPPAAPATPPAAATTRPAGVPN